jgi:parallel beta-helix repeat protein
MQRKIVAVWVSLAIILSVIVLIIDISPPVRGNVIYVGGGGMGNFSTIQEGIDASNPGDTVFVYNGTYYENVLVNKTVNLVGEGRDNVTIDGNGFWEAVTITAENVNITGFNITNGSTGILCSASFASIAGNTVFDNEFYGIYLLPTTRQNVILNNNFSINWGASIYLESSDNNTISGNNITQTLGDAGIHLITSPNNTLANNNVVSNFKFGIIMESFSANNLIVGNNISDNEDGIGLDSSDNNTIYNNYISFNNVGFIGGIFLGSSSNINITNNTLRDNSNGVYLSSSNNNLINRNNFMNHLPSLRFSSSSNNTISNNHILSGGIGISSSSNNNSIFANNILNNSIGLGISLSSSNYNAIASNNISFNDDGVDISSGENNSIINNNISFNNEYGIKIGSSHNFVSENYISNNGYSGIRIGLSSNQSITNNTISFNGFSGIYFGFKTTNNTIVGNNILNNDYGIYFNRATFNSIFYNNISLSNYDGVYLERTANNSFKNNTIFSNNGGINVTLSSNNSIFHNNIINNLYQALDDSDNGNQWDNGYPSGGNYWSDYDGVDLNSTPSQDVPPSDGIGDTPYVIDLDSQDNYPLTNPFGNFTFLYEGWNLISLPLIQSDSNLREVLSPISGSYDAVQWYNTTDTNDPWKHNHSLKPDYLNDFHFIHHKMGFWVHVTELGGVLFKHSGTQPTSNQTIQLHPGWNIVGYPSLTNYNRTKGLNNLEFGTDVDCIQWYDTATQTWHLMGPNDLFVPGRGYWIHSKVETTWEVPL